MINFGMVVFSGKEELKSKGILFSLALKINFGSKKKTFRYIDIEKIELYKNLRLSIIKLPFTIEDYFNFKDNNNKKIIWELSRIMKKEELFSCLFPLKFLEQNQFKSFDGTFFGRKDIFRLLSVVHSGPIIKKYFKEKPHILIIYENNAHELEGALNTAFNYSNYLYVYAQDTRQIEDVINVFRAESGTGVVLADDLPKIAAIADIIVNYSDSDKIFSNLKLKDKVLIFNYGEGFCSKVSPEKTVINDIDIYNDKLIDKVPVSLWDWFSRKEFMNTVFAHLCMNYPEASREYPNYQTLKLFDKIFRESGFRISGYYGKESFTALK